jgi:hypothetical protein
MVHKQNAMSAWAIGPRTGLRKENEECEGSRGKWEMWGNWGVWGNRGMRAVQDLFLPKKVVVVQYGLVHKPVTVVSEKIEMDWMWKNAPGLADFVEDLPVGAQS